MQRVLIEKINPVLRRAKVRRAAVFGSIARGDERADSDLDILIELNPEVSLLQFINLKQQLEEASGRRVDMVEYDALKPALRQKILSEQVALF